MEHCRRQQGNCLRCDAGTLGGIFGGMPDDVLRCLNRAKVTNHYRPGQYVFYQGSPCLGLHCIGRGEVALVRETEAGEELIVRLVSSGAAFGHRALFANQPYRCSARALSKARVCFIDRATLLEQVEAHPPLAQRFLSRLAEELGDANEQRLRSTLLPVRAQLAAVLVELRNRHGEVRADGALEISLPFSRTDLASLIGTRPETIARAIRALKDDGVAAFDGRKVTIEDLDRLLDVAQIDQRLL